MTEETTQKNEIILNSRGLQLRTFDDMYQFGKAVVQSRLAPKSFTTAEQVLVAIQCGAELGMPPMRSLQSFCVINGQARLWGDAPLALVRQSGLLEYIKEEIEGEGDDRVAVCVTKRKGDPKEKRTEFSVADAKQATLWNNKNKPTWYLYPERMLKYRARSFNLRDNFPDCFGGATIAEEYMEHEIPQPSHDISQPRRKVVESVEQPTKQATEEQTSPERSAKHESQDEIQGVLLPVYGLYKKVYEVAANTEAVEAFAKLTSEVCGGIAEDYWRMDNDVLPVLDPTTYDLTMISKIKDHLEGTDKL